jgi:hypothetical protein
MIQNNKILKFWKKFTFQFLSMKKDIKKMKIKKKVKKIKKKQEN